VSKAGYLYRFKAGAGFAFVAVLFLVYIDYRKQGA
jgi:hypothetical protein